jgi:hypothetical protein
MFIWEILANMIQVSDVAPGPLVALVDPERVVRGLELYPLSSENLAKNNAF